MALEERKELFYPPFSRLIKIIVKGSDKNIVREHINKINNSFVSLKSTTILGPSLCPIEKKNNQYRMHLIIKSKKEDWMFIYNFIINKIGLEIFEKKSKNLSTSIDIDPISFI